jgi:hypothetical protein
MRAIRITDPAQHLTFLSNGISIDPDPPCVGTNTRIGLSLCNPGHDPIEVERIDLKIARFGMGLRWENLPAAGPFVVPPQRFTTTDLEWQWTPDEGGHRCVRAHIAIAGRPQPLIVGRNLHVVHSEAEQRTWNIPFRVGNPEDRRAPVMLSLQTPHPLLTADLHVNGKHHFFGDPIWLDAGEEVEATLTLRARAFVDFDVLHMIRATIDGRFIDGIGVQVKCPAYLRSRRYALEDERVLAQK